MVVLHKRDLPPSGSLAGVKLKTVADVNTEGGIPVVFRIDVADAATGDIDVTVDHKIRVIGAWFVKTESAGGALDTVQVKNGANAITNALDLNVADQTIVRATTIDDAQHEIAANGTLRVTRTNSSVNNVACIVYVMALRVA